jgi:hypothetical protein
MAYFDRETGEITDDAPPYEEALKHLEISERKMRGYDLLIAKLRKDLEEVQGNAADSHEIRQVLEYWKARMSKPRCKVIPGSERWKKVKARLKEGFTPDDLGTAVEGACASEGHRVHDALEAATIFKSPDTVEKHIERAMDFKTRFNVWPTQIPQELATTELAYLLEACDCTHARMEHARADEYGLQGCHLCECVHFDTIHEQIDEFNRREKRAQDNGQLFATVYELPINNNSTNGNGNGHITVDDARSAVKETHGH